MSFVSSTGFVRTDSFESVTLVFLFKMQYQIVALSPSLFGFYLSSTYAVYYISVVMSTETESGSTETESGSTETESG